MRSVWGTPYDVAVDSTNHNVYVALGTGGIVEIDESGDANTGKVVQTIAYTAYSLAVDSTSHALLYAFGGTATTFAIIDESGDANTGKVVAQPQIAGGDVIVATVVVADPSTHFLYLSGEDLTQDTVTGWVFDEANDGHTGQSAPGIFGDALAVDPSTHLVFAAFSPGGPTGTVPGQVVAFGTAPGTPSAPSAATENGSALVTFRPPPQRHRPRHRVQDHRDRLDQRREWGPDGGRLDLQPDHGGGPDQWG